MKKVLGVMEMFYILDEVVIPGVYISQTLPDCIHKICSPCYIIP